MGGVHCLVIVYLLIATDASSGGSTHHGGSTVLSPALPVSSTVSTATSTAAATSNGMLQFFLFHFVSASRHLGVKLHAAWILKAKLTSFVREGNELESLKWIHTYIHK
jgi:hypothetical protein